MNESARCLCDLVTLSHDLVDSFRLGQAKEGWREGEGWRGRGVEGGREGWREGKR